MTFQSGDHAPAPAGHPIHVWQDEGINDGSQDFTFYAHFPGMVARVVQEVTVKSRPDGTSELQVFFHKARVYVPSDAYKARLAQLNLELDEKLSQVSLQTQVLEALYEAGKCDFQTYMQKKEEPQQREHDARLEEIDGEYEAKNLDLAGMPTSSFTAMEAAADKFLGLVQQNLQKAERITAQ